MGTDKLGVIAGGGPLPRRVCDAARAQGRDVFVVAIKGQADLSLLDDIPHAEIRLGAAGAAIERLKDEAVRDIVMVGPVKRPSLAQLRPDAEAVRFFATVGTNAFGDDSLLSAVIDFFEGRHGFKVRAVEDFLGPTGVAPGTLTKLGPGAESEEDIRRGLDILTTLGPVDVGQAVIVQQRLVLGIEAIEGTDGLIRRCAQYRRDGAGGTLVKIAKPGQETRVDMPTIGPDTVRNAAESGLAGIAVEARRTIVVDPDTTVAEADRLGLFIVAVTLSGGAGDG